VGHSHFLPQEYRIPLEIDIDFLQGFFLPYPPSRADRLNLGMLITMNVVGNLLTVNPFSRPGNKLSSIYGLVVHWTGNPATSATQNRNYFESLKNQTIAGDARYASAHFIVGLEGEIVQCVPLDELAYHVGAKLYKPAAISHFGNYPNSSSIGIELCHPDASGRFLQSTLDSAIELSAWLCIHFRLHPLSDICTHHGITGKVCPKYFVDHPDAFDQFRIDVDKTVERSAE